ncbi:MAG: hypothetical protein ACPGXW_03685 [Synechococcus sp.]
MHRLVWLLPLALLQACAGSPVAEELQRSFESTERTATEAEAPIPEQPPVVDPAPIDRSQEEEVDEEAATKSDIDTATATDVDAIDVQQPISKSLQPPAPYRITIRLAGADPAAPAEAVTRALRQSEVVFSVERIERITP